jgi:putative inorganic carbon (HCO3(-)) transporter
LFLRRVGSELRNSEKLMIETGFGTESTASAALRAPQSKRPAGWFQRSVPLAMTALCAPLFVLAHRRFRLFLVAVTIVDIPIELGTHFNYQEDVASLGALGGLEFSITTIAVVLMCISCLLDPDVRDRMANRPLSIDLPLVLYLGASLLSIVVAKDQLLSFYEVFVFLQVFLLYFCIANSDIRAGDLPRLVKVATTTLMLEAALMVCLWLAGQSSIGLRNVSGIQLTNIAHDDGGNFLRVSGTIGSPNGAAAYLAFFLTLAVSTLFAQVSRRLKRVSLVAVALGVPALILTFSRGGWVSFLVSITIICLATRKNRLPVRSLAFAGGIALSLGLIFQSSITERLFGDDNGAAQVRLPLAETALRMIGGHPLLGVGANNFPLQIEEYDEPGDWLYTVHNKYLLIAAETGIASLLAFLWFLARTLRRGWRCWKASDPLLSPLALGFTAAIAGLMAHMMVEVFRGRSIIQMLWTSAGFLAILQSHLFGPKYSRARYLISNSRPVGDVALR